MTATCSCPRKLASFSSGLTNCPSFSIKSLHQLFGSPTASGRSTFVGSLGNAPSQYPTPNRRADVQTCRLTGVAAHPRRRPHDCDYCLHHEHHRASSVSQQAIFLIHASKFHRDTFSPPGDALQLTPTDSPAHPPQPYHVGRRTNDARWLPSPHFARATAPRNRRSAS